MKIFWQRWDDLMNQSPKLAEPRNRIKHRSSSILIWGLVYYFGHRYEESINECKKTVALDPTFFVAHQYMGLSYVQLGMHKEARTSFEKAVNASNRSPLIRAEYAYAVALSGDATKAQTELAELIEISNQKYLSAYHIAAIYVALKDNVHALEWLDKAYHDRADWMIFLKVDPRFTAFTQIKNLSDSCAA